jgi:hypothetical protein
LLVLGVAKVISYKELEELQVKRAAKEEAAASKGKRRRKHKSYALEGSAPEATTRMTQTSYVSEP